jgi:hypothetical protein
MAAHTLRAAQIHPKRSSGDIWLTVSLNSDPKKRDGFPATPTAIGKTEMSWESRHVLPVKEMPAEADTPRMGAPSASLENRIAPARFQNPFPPSGASQIGD